MPKINQLKPATSLANTDIMIADTSTGSDTRKIAYSDLRTQVQNESKSVFALKGEVASDDQVADAVGDWLDTHVTPTGSAVAIDDTLKIHGAAADAKAAGEIIVINGTSGNGTRVNITTTDTDIELAEMSDVADLKSAINNCTSNLAGEAVTLNRYIATVNEKVDTLRNDVFEEENIISVSADNMSHVTGDATITFQSSDSFDYARNSAVNNNFGFTFATEPQKTYTLTASLKNVSGGNVNVLICPTAIYNAGAALASQTNITVDTNISMTFTATTAETSLWFVVRYNVPQISVSRLYCTDGVLHFKHGMMDYSGKDITVFNKIICIGDSITEGTFNYTADGSNENVVTIPKYSYPTQLKKMTGIDIVNMGHGGYTAVEWYAAHSADDLSGYDCAIIGFGINDALENVSMSDFTAAYHNIIDKLSAANPGIKVFLLTITPAYTDYNRRYDAYNTEIRRIAAEDYTNAYLVDLTQYSICKYNTAYAQGHLTAIGYMQMAAEITTIISYIIHANPSDFRNVQFIGTGYTYTA